MVIRSYTPITTYPGSLPIYSTFSIFFYVDLCNEGSVSGPYDFLL